VQQNLSVREVEALAKQQQQPKPNNKQKITVNHDVMRLQSTLSDKLGTNVSIAAKANGAGMLKISYSNLDQLDDIIAKFL
jgi:ParB family transcriptional regulator, chromosome partitioning protein